MDEATCNELRRKNIIFNCKNPWEPKNRCMGKCKAHYIEVISNNGEEEEVEKEHDCEHGKSIEKQPQGESKSESITTLSSVHIFHTFRIKGVLQGQWVTVLIDGGETHNFIDSTLVAKRGIPMMNFERFDVAVVGGHVIPYT